MAKATYNVRGYIDIIDLFLHDKFNTGLLSEFRVAAGISQQLKTATGRDGLTVSSPDESGLDRFIVADSGDAYYCKKCNTEAELAACLPADIYKALTEITELK